MGKNGSTGAKLTAKNGKGKYRLEIIKMLAMGFSPSLVAQELEDNFEIKMSRQNILETYKKGKRRLVALYREKMAKEVMKHPLANKNNRLGYLLRALNHALKYHLDKIHFFEGEEIGRVEKVNIGVVSHLIAEAREEIEGYKSAPAEVKLTLLQIIKDVSGNGRIDIKSRAKVDRNIPIPADSLDQQDSGDIEIL